MSNTVKQETVYDPFTAQASWGFVSVLSDKLEDYRPRLVMTLYYGDVGVQNEMDLLHVRHLTGQDDKFLAASLKDLENQLHNLMAAKIKELQNGTEPRREDKAV